MAIIEYPKRSEWEKLLVRPSFDATALFETVQGVMNAVRERGDEALRGYEAQFDKVELGDLRVGEAEFAEAEALVPESLKAAIRKAHGNIVRFHEAQRFAEIKVTTCPGVVCWQRAVPISRVGLYVPGGTAPLFSTVLMLAAPAKIAGCKEIVLCTPPGKDGRVNPVILYTARLAGVGNVFKLGGSQAIAAMALGTESVPKVDKIFGPGNQFVMAAKQLAALHDVAIDMPAGPSEVEVLADDSANPAFVAADLLSQAEHGADSQVVLVSTSRRMLEQVQEQIEIQKQALPRVDMVNKSLSNSKFILVHDEAEAIDISNAYAPEHLVIAMTDSHRIADGITNAGSVFLGNYSCESAGDYASGTNHTLPTKGYARAYSGLNLDSYMRKMTLQEVTSEGVHSIGEAVAIMAANEQLNAHERAMRIRMEYVEKNENK